MRVWAIVVAVLPLLGCAGQIRATKSDCEKFSRTYDRARVVQDRERFVAIDGDKSVFEVYHFCRRDPVVIDGIGGYSLLVEVDSGVVVPGRTISLPGEDAQAFVFVLEAPTRRSSQNVTGTIRITSAVDGSVTALIDVQCTDLDWSLRETTALRNTAVEFFGKTEEYVRKQSARPPV